MYFQEGSDVKKEEVREENDEHASKDEDETEGVRDNAAAADKLTERQTELLLQHQTQRFHDLQVAKPDPTSYEI